MSKSEPSVAVISVFMDNLPLSISHYQGKVVAKVLGDRVDHYQILSTISHGAQLDRILGNLVYDYYLLLDIDAIPLCETVLDWLTDSDQKNSIRGHIQISNHLNAKEPFVGPSFMGFWRETYLTCGSPSFAPTEKYDVGESFCKIAKEKGFSLDFLTPISVLGEPKWSLLTDEKNVGIGTSFGNEGVPVSFHNFEIRKQDNQRTFIDMCKRQLDEKEGRFREPLSERNLLRRVLRR